MGFAISTNGMPCITSFEVADKHFNNTKPVKSAKWDENIRPLRARNQSHIVLQKGRISEFGVPYYDLVLYRTPLIRYFQPNEQGERAVWLTNHSSQSSQKFMGHHGWYNLRRMMADNNTDIHIPISNASEQNSETYGDWRPCTTRLVIDTRNRVILDKSAAIPLLRTVTSKDVLEERKHMRRELELVANLMDMGYATLADTIRLPYRHWQNNSHIPSCSYLATRAVEGAVRQLADGDTFADIGEAMPYLMEYVTHRSAMVAQMLAQHRFTDLPYSLRNALNTFTVQILGTGADVTVAEFVERFAPTDNEDYAAAVKRVMPTQAEVRSRVLDDLLSMAGNRAATMDAYEVLPMFPVTNTLPSYRAIRSYWPSAAGTVKENVTEQEYQKYVARKEPY